MEQINFRDWRVMATVQDTGILKLDVEALNGSDILEVGYAGPEAGHVEQYALRLTTQQIEESHNRPGRQSAPPPEPETEDEGGPGWLADEDETIYTRGWEVTAMVDEEGMLEIQIERGDDAEIYEVEPLESGTPLSSHIMLRLAAEEVDTDEDEDEDEDEIDSDVDDYEDNEDFDDLDDDYDRYNDEDEDEDLGDLFDDAERDDAY